MISVKDFGAIGNGIADDTISLQSALNKGGEIYIPKGDYKISATLVVKSNTKVVADSDARVFMDGSKLWRAHEYLLKNQEDSENIEIIGGVWDGNNQGEKIDKGDIFDLDGYSGTVLNFYKLKNLTLKNLTVANSLTYNIRMARLTHFYFENISFFSEKIAYNQDGLHFNGYVKDGVVKNVKAISCGQTNDDLIALNADDSMKRVENVGMEMGPIENITFEKLYAEDCHTLIRLLSVDSPIRNIKIKDVCAGFRMYAINIDGARYCKTPLFKEEERPEGVGIIENVEIENMTCYRTKNDNPAITLESQMKNFELRNFCFKDKKAVLEAKNCVSTTIIADGKEYEIKEKTDKLKLDDFNTLRVN